jgi:hypothetical protein
LVALGLIVVALLFPTVGADCGHDLASDGSLPVIDEPDPMGMTFEIIQTCLRYLGVALWLPAG